MKGPKKILELQRAQYSKDGQGGRDPTYYYVRKIIGILTPRNIKGLSAGLEKMSGNKVLLSTTLSFYVDYPNEKLDIIKETDRLVLGIRIFNIIFIGDPDSQERQLRLDLEERK